MLLALLLSVALAAEPAGIVDLLTEACLISSRSDCRAGVYRMSAKNAEYLEAVLTGLAQVAGVAEGRRRNRAGLREVRRLALYSLAFSGRGEEAIPLGHRLLGELEDPWIRLALVEAARQAWRADVLRAQLDALGRRPPSDPAARFLADSFLAERRARQQPPDWATARGWFGALRPPSRWPVGSEHLQAQALAAWQEILLGAARTEAQRKDAFALLNGVAGLDARAVLYERIRRLADLREHQEWETAIAEAERLRAELERLAAADTTESERARLQALAQRISSLCAQNKTLDGRGLQLMPGNLRPHDPSSGELSRLECSYYKERARLLLALPQPTAERLQQARLCLEVSAARQQLVMLTQSPLATVDPPVFDLVELELRQKTPGWEQRALEQAGAAVQLFEQYASRPGLVAALACQGEVYLAQGNRTAARAALSRSVELAEKHVAEFGYTGSWARRFRQRYAKAYELLLQLEVGEGNSSAAGELLSRFQQLQLAELRQNSLTGRVAAPLLRLRGGALTDELPPPPSAVSAGAAVTLARGKGEFFQQLGTLRQQHPEYEKLLAVRPVNYAQTQKWIPADTAVVQFFPASDCLYIFWVTRGDFKIHKLNVAAEALRRRVWEMRKAMVGDFLSRGGQAPLEPAQEASMALYQHLIQPLQADLPAYQTLAFVPTGFLCYVPFQALGQREGDGRFHYLIEKQACITLLKSSDLEVLAQPGGPAAGALLALGNPDGSLPAATREAEQIAGLFKGSRAYVGGAASRDKLDKLPAQTRLLHLATHGHLDSQNPSQSYLVLGGPGRLSVPDIYALTLPEVRLVTLSACQTGLGQADPGSEVASLADAFGIAGARTVVASLWSVEDSATQKLMLAFYGQLKQGKSLAQCLRQAQLELLAEPQYRAPFFWAPFCLYGDWR